MTSIFGLGGKLASGKSEVANRLRDAYGFSVVEMSDPLHAAMMELNPIISSSSPAIFFWRHGSSVRYRDLIRSRGYVEAKKHPEVRRLLQTLGTEVGRNMIDKNVWVDVMKQTVSNIIANGKDVVIPSVRFVNELEAVTDLGGETWWVVRPSLQAGANAGHSSENSVFETDFDRTIRNDGTLEDLYKKIDDILD